MRLVVMGDDDLVKFQNNEDVAMGMLWILRQTLKRAQIRRAMI